MGEHLVERSGNRLRSLPGDLIGRPRLRADSPSRPTGRASCGRAPSSRHTRASEPRPSRATTCSNRPSTSPASYCRRHGPQCNAAQWIVVRRIEQFEGRGPIARLPQRLHGGVSEGRIGLGQVIFQPVRGSGPPQAAQGDDDFKLRRGDPARCRARPGERPAPHRPVPHRVDAARAPDRPSRRWPAPPGPGRTARDRTWRWPTAARWPCRPARRTRIQIACSRPRGPMRPAASASVSLLSPFSPSPSMAAWASQRSK